MAQIIVFDRHEADFEEYRTAAEKCIDGQPVQRSWNHFTSSDGRFFSGLWEGEPGRWRIRYTENEFCRILSGRSILHSADGEAYEFRAGDDFVIPAGFEGEWEVVETTKKLYAIYQP